MKSLAAILTLTVMLCGSLPVYSASPAFDQAVADYKARRYSAALTGFQTIAAKSPTDALSHYYMALCYQGMNQISLAKGQYEWVTANTRDPALLSYAQTGLATLSKFPTSFAGSSTPAPAAGRATSPIAAGGGPKVTGRLKVLEFSTDW